jgi:hypothetical protein
MVTLSCEEKSKFEPEEKKFSLVLKVEFSSRKPPEHSTFSTKLTFFFPRVQVLIFLCKATQGDHIRLLYKFEMCAKNFG